MVGNCAQFANYCSPFAYNFPTASHKKEIILTRTKLDPLQLTLRINMPKTLLITTTHTRNPLRINRWLTF